MFFSRLWGASQSVQIDLSRSTPQENPVETSTDDLDDSQWTDLKYASFSLPTIIEATPWRSELSSLTGERVSLRHRGDGREEDLFSSRISPESDTTEEEDSIFEVVSDDPVQLGSVKKSEEEEDDDSLESSSLQITIQNTASLMESTLSPSLSPPDRIVTHTLDPEYIRRGFHLML